MPKSTTSPPRKKRKSGENPLPVLWAQMILGLPGQTPSGPARSPSDEDSGDAADEVSIPPSVPPGDSATPTPPAAASVG